LRSGARVIAFPLLFLLVSVCIPQVCSADTIFDRFSEGERFGLNYQRKNVVFNITSGTKTESSSIGGGYLDFRVYDQYINVTEFKKQWYTIDRSRRINGTDTMILWCIDTNVRIGDTVKILDDPFTVVGKGVQKPWMSLWECWILSRDNVVAYYDTEYGLLINLINITQIEGKTAKGTVLFLSSPDPYKMGAVMSASMEAHFYTSFPPLITFTVLVSVFVLTRYHIPRRVRLWLKKIKR